MAICAKISAGIAFDCDNPLIPGVDAEQLILINRSDIDTVTLDVSNKHIVTALTLSSASGTAAYAYEGINNSVRPLGESLTDGFTPFKFSHAVEFRIFDRTAPTKEQVRNIVAGDIVAIYFRKGQTIEIMGLDTGLNNNTVTFNEYEEDSAYLMNIATDTDNGDFEPFLPRTFDTGAGFAADKATILALLVPAP